MLKEFIAEGDILTKLFEKKILVKFQNDSAFLLIGINSLSTMELNFFFRYGNVILYQIELSQQHFKKFFKDFENNKSLKERLEEKEKDLRMKLNDKILEKRDFQK